VIGGRNRSEGPAGSVDRDRSERFAKQVIPGSLRQPANRQLARRRQSRFDVRHCRIVEPNQNNGFIVDRCVSKGLVGRLFECARQRIENRSALISQQRIPVAVEFGLRQLRPGARLLVCRIGVLLGE
jgi:hypothetical protein